MSKKQDQQIDHKNEADKTVRNIRRQTRRNFSAEEKIRIVLAGLRGEESIAELCRHEGIHQNLYYRRSRDFLEAGKKRLSGIQQPGIPKSTFYNWYDRYLSDGLDTLSDKKPRPVMLSGKNRI